MIHVSKFTTCRNSGQYPQSYLFPKSRWDVEEITVLGVMHHAHLLGKRLKIEVTRDGEYIGTLEQNSKNTTMFVPHPYQQVEHLLWMTPLATCRFYRCSSCMQLLLDTFCQNFLGRVGLLPIRTHLRTRNGCNRRDA